MCGLLLPVQKGFVLSAEAEHGLEPLTRIGLLSEVPNSGNSQLLAKYEHIRTEQYHIVAEVRRSYRNRFI